jgi:hypothetical protein
MILVRKNDVSLALFSEAKVEDNRITLVNPDHIEFLYQMLVSMILLDDTDIAIHLESSNTTKLHSCILEVNLIEEGLEVVVLE